MYLLMMLNTFLPVTETLHKYLQSQIVDLAAELYDSAKAYCAANQIPESCSYQTKAEAEMHGGLCGGL